MIVRSAVDDDLSAIREVSLAAGQPKSDSGADAAYVSLLRRTGTVLVTGEPGNRIVGWGATRPTKPGSMLTDLFIHPRWQGRGIGTRLLRGLWPEQPHGAARFTFSSRHAHALPVYARSGLAPSWPLLYLGGDPRRLGVSPVTARRVEAALAARVERQLTGMDRCQDYAYWAREDTAVAMVIHRGTRAVAAGVGVPSQLVHLTCPHPRDTVVALLAALTALESAQVSLWLPGPHPALALLLTAGFRIRDYDICMATPDIYLPTTWVYSSGLA